MQLIKPVYADTLDLGQIQGTGKYQTGSATSLIPQLDVFLSNIITALTLISAIAFLLFFMVGALSWITAGGDKNKVDSAQKTMTNAAIGMIAVVVSYFIAAIIGSVLGVDILNPVKGILNL